MSAGEPDEAERAARILPDTTLYPEDPSTWSSGEVLRLLLTPAIVAVLFVGGISWVKLRLPASQPGRDDASTVQVHLLTRQAVAPPPDAETPQSTAPRV